MTEVLSFLLHDVGGNVIAAALIAGVGFGLEKTLKFARDLGHSMVMPRGCVDAVAWSRLG
ncbi:hypothetical protein ACFRFU_44535 [Streptomyces sp. NPDC056704]|uniref:hypothetical protein n=1 Tax=Streptomyces sp. NPDC056704 TaxID=3345917 RepID=UPI0036C26131